MTRRALILGALLAAAAGHLRGQTPGADPDRAQRAYDTTSTFSATFTQTIINPMIGAPERSRGTLWLAKPDKFAMRFADPAGDRIVADGHWLWIYTPTTTPDQVLRQRVPTTGNNSPNLFGQFVDHPDERYVMTSAGVDTVAGVVTDLWKLVPRAAGTGFNEAVIAVARTDGQLRRIALVEESGQRRELVFTSIAVNRPVPPAEVSFTPPRGVKVVTP